MAMLTLVCGLCKRADRVTWNRCASVDCKGGGGKKHVALLCQRCEHEWTEAA